MVMTTQDDVDATARLSQLLVLTSKRRCMRLLVCQLASRHFSPGEGSGASRQKQFYTHGLEELAHTCQSTLWLKSSFAWTLSA